MFPSAPPEPSSRPRGSRRRVLRNLSALCLVVVAGLLFYDVPLKPYGDLLPAMEDEPDPEENGFLYLQRAWESPPEAEWGDAKRLALEDGARVAKMTSRARPWDDALAARVRTGQEAVTPGLRHAAALPRWVPSLEEREDRGRWTTPAHTWMYQRRAIVALEACAAARAGNAEEAFEIWKAQHIAAARQVEGCRDVDTLLAGLALQDFSASLACDLLEWLPEDTALLTRLEEHWKTDPFTNAVAETALRGELRWLWAELDGSGPLHEDLDSLQWPAAARLLVKKNMTMNRCSALVRIFGGKLLVPAPASEAAASFAFMEAGRGTNPVSPNYFGNRLAGSWTRGMGALNHIGLRSRLFVPRAMRVRLALQRWRLARGETPPAVLTELVPEFLPEVPADPWNGQPLGWDPATWTVSAVGYDWNAAAGAPGFKFGNSWLAWIDRSHAGPGLRAILPPGAAAGYPDDRPVPKPRAKR